MPLPDSVRDDAAMALDRFCAARSSQQIRLEHRARGATITLAERRPPWLPGGEAEWSAADIAQLRYDETSARWSLYWPRASGRWERYDGIEPANDVAPLVAEIEATPTASSGADPSGEAARSRPST